MRSVWTLLLVIVLGLAAGLWFAAHLGFQPFAAVGGAVPKPLVRLHAHLAAWGVPTRVGLVRRERAQVNAKALFTERSHGRVFIVMWCTTPEHAARLAAETGGKAVNGPFILYMTDWPSDDETTRKVLQAFGSFDAAQAVAG